jgi:hypothetical protein
LTLAPLLNASPVIQLHAFAAIAAFVRQASASSGWTARFEPTQDFAVLVIGGVT